MLTTFSARAAPETMRGLAARGWPRRGESAAKPTAPGAPYGAWGRRRRPLWVLECAFASPWPAARCQSTQVGAHANYFSLREDANYPLQTVRLPAWPAAPCRRWACRAAPRLRPLTSRSSCWRPGRPRARTHVATRIRIRTRTRAHANIRVRVCVCIYIYI